MQILIILIGTLITSSLAMVTNLTLPTINHFEFNWLGQVTTIFWLSTITFSIVRYRLFDIRFLVGQFVYYSFQAAILYLAFYFFINLYLLLFGSVFAIEALILGIPLAYGFMILYSGFNKFIRNYTDTKLINPGYNPLEVVDELNKSLSTVLDEKKIIESTLETISKTIRPEFVGLVVIEPNKTKKWRSYAHKEQEVLNPSDFKLAANIWDETDYRPLVIDDFDYELLNRFLNVPHLIQELEKLMQAHNIKVIYPLGDKEKISGMLLLGKKEADSPYSLQDMKFLDSLTRSASVAINRSMLYQEIQDFNIGLQKQVEEATGELKTKNKTLEETLSNLEEIRRQERDMIDVMGHELRTPISIVRNALLVLNSKFKGSNGKIETETLGKYLDMAVESVRREITLIETLLSATKVEGNRIQLQLTKVDLLDVVNDSIEALKRDADQKNLPIKFDAKDQIFVFADRVRCQEIMDNFLSNAIKYTPKGVIEIQLTADDKSGTIRVKDSGVGISSADIAKLGKKFFRAQPHYSAEQGSRPSGTGLGLYVTFELINVMFGTRIVESELGKGSTFGFSLPIFNGQQDKGIDQTFMTDPKLAKNAIDTGVK
jgi:signal transduction histidine kinase